MTEEKPEYGDEEAGRTSGSSAVQEGADLTLEERIRRLEQILSSLENDDHTLDEALELFEEGIRHVRTSEELLDSAMLKVEELLDDDGTTRPLDRDEE
ncbi:MAG TPA: exodeoxyribonuclease VII small subunit [Longimicrobiales bacterium]|nr:exodeoxyribonuclease VII small subunit [Longimicrobiales bacterium]